jgi:GT2 family glycosyltransferase
MNNVEIISVHYKTPEYIYEQYESIRKFYPFFKYRIIDGSDDNKKYFQDLESKDNNFIVERKGFNIHHGPGMDYAIKTSKMDYLLILDSDISLKSPPIEEMLNIFKGYSVGKKLIMDSTGHEHPQKPERPIQNFIYEYIHPYCMLISKKRYLDFHPFVKHGSPCIKSMIDIHNKNKQNELVDFDIKKFVNFRTKGTRDKWGLNI